MRNGGKKMTSAARKRESVGNKENMASSWRKRHHQRRSWRPYHQWRSGIISNKRQHGVIVSMACVGGGEKRRK